MDSESSFDKVDFRFGSASSGSLFSVIIFFSSYTILFLNYFFFLLKYNQKLFIICHSRRRGRTNVYKFFQRIRTCEKYVNFFYIKYIIKYYILLTLS